MKDIDLAWLAGIWDGEGSISLFQGKEKNGGLKIRPVLSVVNTDIILVNKVQQLLDELGCNFHMREFQPTNKKHKTQWRFITSNSQYIITFLEAVLPYLNSEKKARGEIVLRYVRQRSAKVDKRDFNGTTPYDEEDWEYVNQIRSSETTREAA